MNRYLQKILELKFHFILNTLYKYSPPKAKVVDIPTGPKISIIIPVYRPKSNWLKDCIDSVVSQSYPNWELILVDDHSDDPQISLILKEYSANPLIKVITNKTNQNIVNATNIGLKTATGQWVGFLDHDDILLPNCLSLIVTKINSDNNLKFIYTDQDKIDEKNFHFDPFLKQDFNPTLLRQTNYINHFTVIESKLLANLNYLRQGTDGAQDWDLILRASTILKPTQIAHIPKILYSWRVSANSTASDEGMIKSQDKISSVQKEVLSYDLQSRHLNHPIFQTRYLGIWHNGSTPPILPYQMHLLSLFNLIRHV